MKARTAGVLGFLCVAMLGLAACGDDSQPPGDAGGPLHWKQTADGTVPVSVDQPSDFVTSNIATYPREVRAWKAVITVTNHSDQPFNASSLRVSASAGGTSQEEVIDPVNGCFGIGDSQVMPGETVPITACWTGAEHPRAVDVTSADGKHSVMFGD